MTASTRRERRQQQRRQQRRSGGGGRSGGINQLWVVLGVAAAVIGLVLVGRAAGVFDPPVQSSIDVDKVDVSGQPIGEHRTDLGNDHIPSGAKANYTSLPPTSGQHWAAPAGPVSWGIKSAFVPFEATTHNLEHGGIVIVYRDLASADVDKLKAVVRTLGSSGYTKIILEPYPDLQGAKIALTAWNWLLTLQNVDETSIVKFVRQHYDHEAPEKGVP